MADETEDLVYIGLVQFVQSSVECEVTVDMRIEVLTPLHVR